MTDKLHSKLLVHRDAINFIMSALVTTKSGRSSATPPSQIPSFSRVETRQIYSSAYPHHPLLISRMSSDRRNLKRISALLDRKPLQTPESESSDPESSIEAAEFALSAHSSSSEIQLSEKIPQLVPSTSSKSRKNGRLAHDADQKTIENTFHEIQYYSGLRLRRKNCSLSNAGSVSDDFRNAKETILEVSEGSSSTKAFRSGFADTAHKPVTTSILDSRSFIEGQFFGFYVLFWLSVGFYILKHMYQSEFTDQLPLYKAPVYLTFTRGLMKIAVTDLIMYLSIYVVYFIQLLCFHDVIQWRKTGRALTSAYELIFFFSWVFFVGEIVVKDQWIGRTFLILHMFVLIMKMHSYAFYNGYLWKILRELQFSESYLERLHNGSVSLPAGFEKENTTKLLTSSIAFCKFELLHQSVLLDKADEKGTLEMDSAALCKMYLLFPSNIYFYDFFMYTMFPTVLYSLKFARTEKIRWSFVLEKLAAMVGVIFIMLLIAEYNVYPIVMKCLAYRKIPLSLTEKSKLLVTTIFDLVPPLLLEYLLTFYLIWHVILNLIAEVARYADRDFYGHWWALLDWEEFSRLWNKPVHRFLLRHVYHSSISALSLSKTSSMLLTFFISSVVHELMMYVVFGRVRGFLFFFQMFQLPLILLNQSPILKNHKTLRNILCWQGIVIAPGLIPASYLVF